MVIRFYSTLSSICAIIKIYMKHNMILWEMWDTLEKLSAQARMYKTFYNSIIKLWSNSFSLEILYSKSYNYYNQIFKGRND